MAVFRSVPSDGLLKVFIVCHSRPQDAVFRFTSKKGSFLLHRHYKYYIGCLHLQIKSTHFILRLKSQKAWPTYDRVEYPYRQIRR